MYLNNKSEDFFAFYVGNNAGDEFCCHEGPGGCRSCNSPCGI